MTTLRDPATDSIMMEYPELPYKAARAFNMDLYAGENACGTLFLRDFRVFIPVWEFSYYFLTTYLDGAVVRPQGAMSAGLFSEGHAALRASFLLQRHGYQPDAIASMRRAHESLIRAVACQLFPMKAETIVRSTDIARTEHDLKLNFQRLYKLESGFVHSNRARVAETMVAVHSNTEPPSQYGPHYAKELHDVLSKMAAFWLYFGISVVPIVIPPEVNQNDWLKAQADARGLLSGYLKDSGSGLAADCSEVDAMVDRVGGKS